MPATAPPPRAAGAPPHARRAPACGALRRTSLRRPAVSRSAHRRGRRARRAGPARPIALAGAGGGSGGVGGDRVRRPGRSRQRLGRGFGGVNPRQHPDSYAELGGDTFADRHCDGRAALHDSAAGHLGEVTRPSPTSAISASAAAPWTGCRGSSTCGGEFAGALRIPYDDGRWSGAVRISDPPRPAPATCWPSAGSSRRSACRAAPGRGCRRAACRRPRPQRERGVRPGRRAGSPVSSGPRARAAAQRAGGRAGGRAPAAVKGIIAAGNQIVGRPYLDGGGHGLPLDEVAPDL